MLTLPGAKQIGRTAAGFAVALGCNDMVAASVKEFEDEACVHVHVHVHVHPSVVQTDRQTDLTEWHGDSCLAAAAAFTAASYLSMARSSCDQCSLG